MCRQIARSADNIKTKESNNMIDFATQARTFLELTTRLKISANAQCLYFQLLNSFMFKTWTNSLKISNIDLHNLTHLSRQQLTNARHELQRLSLIDYKNGAGSGSGEYTLIDLKNAKFDKILENSQKSDAQIADLTALRKSFDNFPEENKIWANFVVTTLEKAIAENRSGIYDNTYVNAQIFLKAKNELQLKTIWKIVTTLKCKPDIIDKESYVLAILANEVEFHKRRYMR